MPDAVLDTTQRVESVWGVPPGACVVRLLVPSVAVGVFIDRYCVVHRVEVMRRVISAMRELFSKDEGVEFWPSIVQASELFPWEENHLPASTETRLLARRSWEFP